MRKNNWIYQLLVVLLISVAVFIRFVRLDEVPSSLYYDEVDLGYQIKSLLTTGKDYRGELNPFYFRSFNTDRTPFPVYFSVFPSLLFNSSEYQVRAGAAIAGVICVVLGMIIAYQLTKSRSAGLITGLVFAFSPWQIQFSRVAFEAIFMLMVLLASVSIFLFWQSSNKHWAFYLSAVLLGLNIYTYRTMSLLAPLVILLLIAIYYRDILKQGWLRTGIWLSIMGAMILPFLYATTIGSADQTRIEQISVMSDPEIPIQVMRDRELDSNDFKNPQIGKQAVWWSPIFHNKVLSYFSGFGNNYYKNFSVDFLFLSGDPNGRHSIGETGVLLFVDWIGLIAGLVLVIKNIKLKKYQLLLGLLILSPVPSDLTMDGANHASRLMSLAGPLLLIIGLGYSELTNWFTKNNKLRLGFILLVSLWLVAVGFYLHRYFIHFPIENARQFGYGYKQAIQKIVSVKDQYRYVRLTNQNDPPMLYYFFWSGTKPIEVQTYGTDYSEKIVKGLPLDMIKPVDWGAKVCETDEIAKLDSNTVYLTTYNNLPMDFRGDGIRLVPDGIKLIDAILYPDNEVAYYLITREVMNGKEVMPNESTACK